MNFEKRKKRKKCRICKEVKVGYKYKYCYSCRVSKKKEKKRSQLIEDITEVLFDIIWIYYRFNDNHDMAQVYPFHILRDKVQIVFDQFF